MRQKPSVRAVDVLRLAAEVHKDPRTVVRVITGGGSRYSRSAVEDAAKRLGIALPELDASEGARLR
jgi:hypothetical protein